MPPLQIPAQLALNPHHLWMIVINAKMINAKMINAKTSCAILHPGADVNLSSLSGSGVGQNSKKSNNLPQKIGYRVQSWPSLAQRMLTANKLNAGPF